MKLNRRAIELSVNMIVVLILSIVILSAGVFMSYKFFGSANEVTEVPLQNLENLVLNFNCNKDERFCALVDETQLDPKGYSRVNVKLTNDQGARRSFGIFIYPNKAYPPLSSEEIGTDFQGNVIQPLGSGENVPVIYPETYADITLEDGESIEKVFLVQQGPTTDEGKYRVVVFAIMDEGEGLGSTGCNTFTDVFSGCLRNFDEIRQKRDSLYGIVPLTFTAS